MRISAQLPKFIQRQALKLRIEENMKKSSHSEAVRLYPTCHTDYTCYRNFIPTASLASLLSIPG